MFRNIQHKLLAWKDHPRRKPLVLMGARQVGKTYALREFGQTHFPQTHYLDFQRDRQLHPLFAENLKPERILTALEFYLDCKISSQDLLIFDEIQECPDALTSLKYFQEEMPQLPLCGAGSLLGLEMGEGSFPVGKVNFLDLDPMSFTEFLQAIGEERSYKFLTQLEAKDKIPSLIHEKLMEKFRHYLVVGGVPEAVWVFSQNAGDLWVAMNEVREVQENILNAYLQDFTKHAGKVSAKDIVLVFENIPAQVAKENKKFQFSKLVPQGRYQRFRHPISWLEGAGLIHQVKICHAAQLPLEGFTKENNFKLYLFDVGLLGVLTRLAPQELILKNNLFSTYKGAFCENFVAQALNLSLHRKLYSWSQNTSEVEFLLPWKGNVLPIEVKAGQSGKLKNLNVFAKKYQPPYRIRINSQSLEYNKEAQFYNFPLYLTERIPEWAF